MSCNNNVNNNQKCNCSFNVKTVGVCDVSRLDIDGTKRENLNWTEISVPEILCIPEIKPDIEDIDQVYVNVNLENIKLIETPFAYKQYVLASFFTAIQDLLTTLPAAITALGTALTPLLTALETTLIGLFNTLITLLTPFNATPGVSALITLINGFIITINTLITNLNTALTNVTNAAATLLAAIVALPFSVQAVCSAIQALIAALNALTTLVDSIVPLLDSMLSAIQNALSILPALVQTAVAATLALLVTLINTTIPPLVTAVVTAITDILDLFVDIDCANASIFVLIGNAEGTCLSGRKLIVEGTLSQKVVYTAEVDTQSVHSAHYEIPFISFIIPYAKFDGAVYTQNVAVIDPVTGLPLTVNGFQQTNAADPIIVDLDEDFTIDSCVEDIYVYALNARKVFKNVTLFLKATPKAVCIQ